MIRLKFTSPALLLMILFVFASCGRKELPEFDVKQPNDSDGLQHKSIGQIDPDLVGDAAKFVGKWEADETGEYYHFGGPWYLDREYEFEIFWVNPNKIAIKGLGKCSRTKEFLVNGDTFHVNQGEECDWETGDITYVNGKLELEYTSVDGAWISYDWVGTAKRIW